MNFGARGCAFDCCTRDEGRMMIPRVASAEQMNLEPQSRARMRGGGIELFSGAILDPTYEKPGWCFLSFRVPIVVIPRT